VFWHLAGHPVPCCWRQGGFLRPRRLRLRCPAPLPHAAKPGSRTRLDLRFLVAGPGFEPGKTVVGDFTDPARYCPDLRGYQSHPPLWHAFDMTTQPVWHPPLRDLMPSAAETCRNQALARTWAGQQQE